MNHTTCLGCSATNNWPSSSAPTVETCSLSGRRDTRQSSTTSVGRPPVFIPICQGDSPPPLPRLSKTFKFPPEVLTPQNSLVEFADTLETLDYIIIALIIVMSILGSLMLVYLYTS